MIRTVRLCCKKFVFWFVIVLTSLLVIEKLVYYFNSKYWLPLKCETKSCTRILLVADPQIIGNKNEVIHSLTPLAIYDSDNYLYNTYSYAFDFVRPDLVIFLGDLMDEGSTATDTDFRQYVRRLFNIFQVGGTDSQNIRHIWLPGDNDIGGEGMDRVTPEKIKRFNQAFSQPDIIFHNNLTFYKINKMTQSIPKIKVKEFYDTKNIFVGLSHAPLMFAPTMFTRKVLDDLKPQLLFTAHEHKSMVINTDALIRRDRQILPLTPENNAVLTYNLGVTDMYEILVPTCSYRMGTDKIGYGYAVIDGNELQYTVLWCPSRFLQLVLYAALVMLNSVIYLMCLCSRQRNKQGIYRKLKNVV